VATAGLALVAVLTVAVAAQAAGSGRVVAPQAATAVPVTSMLQPADAGPDYTVDREELPRPHRSLADLLYQCPAGRSPSAVHLADRGRVLAVGGYSRPGEFVIQGVRRYGSVGEARQTLAAVRNNAAACPEFVKSPAAGGNLHGTMRITVLATDFAGPGSLALRAALTSALPSGAITVFTVVIVGEGDLVSEVETASVDAVEAVRIGRAAAARL
jgi:hypothetical protein